MCLVKNWRTVSHGNKKNGLIFGKTPKHMEAVCNHQETAVENSTAKQERHETKGANSTSFHKKCDKFRKFSQKVRHIPQVSEESATNLASLPQKMLQILI